MALMSRTETGTGVSCNRHASSLTRGVLTVEELAQAKEDHCWLVCCVFAAFGWAEWLVAQSALELEMKYVVRASPRQHVMP